MAWEVDWAFPGNTGQMVWARNPSSHIPSGRAWHFVATGHLRRAGLTTPTYRSDSWQVDWSKRQGKMVWACNPQSKFAAAREWHFVHFHTLEAQGIRWQPVAVKTGRSVGPDGYVMLWPRAMTHDDVLLADAHDLWIGKQRNGRRKRPLHEHRLVATKKYGRIPPGQVVRHLNGRKADNRPENLVLGTSMENTADHETARLMAMYWRDKYEALALEIGRALEPSPWIEAKPE